MATRYWPNYGSAAQLTLPLQNCAGGPSFLGSMSSLGSPVDRSWYYVPPKILGWFAVIDHCSSEASRCFLCDEVSNRIIWRENGHEGRLCRCGMLYTNQATMRMPADPTLDNHAPEFYSLPAQLKANWIARYCPPGRLLEIGCGDGFFLAAARKCGYEVWGIEPNKYFWSTVSYRERALMLFITVIYWPTSPIRSLN
jgi:hypothetical protein